MHILMEKPSALGITELGLGKRVRLKIRFLNSNWWEYSCLGKLFLKKKNKAKAHKQKETPVGAGDYLGD